MPFEGFPAESFAFYRRLEKDNTTEHWHDSKAEYDRCVREPMEALAEELEPDFGPTKLFRPRRDTRFSSDKSPYKTYQGLTCGDADGVGYYLQIDAGGMLVLAGIHPFSSEHLDRYRHAVDDDTTGPELDKIIRELRRQDFDLEGERLKTQPRGFPADHPRVELLRFKSLGASRRHKPTRALQTRKAINMVRGDWGKLEPLVKWAATHAPG